MDQQQELERSQKVAQALTIGRGKRRRAQVSLGRIVICDVCGLLTLALLQVNYKLEAPSPTKDSRGSSPSLLEGQSSGDDYRDKEDLDSDYEGQEPMTVDDLALLDPSDPSKPPPLARLAGESRGGRRGSPSSSNGTRRRRTRGEPDDDQSQRERNDRRALEALRQDAASVNHDEARRLIFLAGNASSRSERSESRSTLRSRAQRACLGLLTPSRSRSRLSAPSYLLVVRCKERARACDVHGSASRYLTS